MKYSPQNKPLERAESLHVTRVCLSDTEGVLSRVPPRKYRLSIRFKVLFLWVLKFEGAAEKCSFLQRGTRKTTSQSASGKD